MIKTTVDDIKGYIRNIRTNENVSEKNVVNNKQQTTQEFVKKMRKLNEEDENEITNRENKETTTDQAHMEKWFNDYFKDSNVIVKYDNLVVYDDLIFWSGTIDGVIQFVFKVSSDNDINGVEFNYTDDIDIQNPENDEIAKKVEEFYIEFYNYWKNNVLQS